MWKSKSLLSAAVAALLLLGIPILGGERLPAALAQVNVTFKEWPVPTKGSHPHDPLAAADGSLWYTGQMASTLGRLDPETGVFKESFCASFWLQGGGVQFARQHQKAFEQIIVRDDEFALVGRVLRPRVGALVEATLGQYPGDALVLRGSRGHVAGHQRLYRGLG